MILFPFMTAWMVSEILAASLFEFEAYPVEGR